MNGSPIVSVVSRRSPFGSSSSSQWIEVAMEDVRDDEADDQRTEADEQPLTQLLEMLDERRLLAVPEPARWADAHRSV